MKKHNTIISLFLALLVMALWGSLFPFVKIGYKAFGINPADTYNVILFAGLRFVVCGVILCLISSVRKEKIAQPKKKHLSLILLSGTFAIILHYAFTYIGLSYTDSSKTALLKQLAPLIYSCFAFLFIKDEKFSYVKIIGAIIGFSGILAINYTSNGFSFSVGDILIIAASVCSVVSSVLSKEIVKNTSPFCSTAISQLFGGIVLTVAAILLGADFPSFTLKATLVFTYICASSTIAYVLYGYLLRTSSVSRMFIIKFAEPLFACLFGAILLGEDIFKIQYLAAFVLISVGIMLGNKSDKD